MIIDLNHSDRSDVPYRMFTFPDGQPHCVFDPEQLRRAVGDGEIEIIVAIKSALDLVNIALVHEAIQSVFTHRPPTVSLNISYLLGARMDRPIAPGQPATLAVVAALLSATVDSRRIRILDPHSPTALDHLPSAQVLHPDRLVALALARITAATGKLPVVIIPDAGAVARTTAILACLDTPYATARCSKKRDSQSGKLSGFQLEAGSVQSHVAVIVDDICDGGGTFAGIAQVLRENGAIAVYLCVTHGVFSKGIDIAGIDGIFTTDSFQIPSADGYEVEADSILPSVLHYKRDQQVRLTVMTQFVASLVRGM